MDLIPIEHKHNTRFRETAVVVPRTEKTLAQRSYYVLGPKLFGFLPNEVKQANSISYYKNNVRKWIKSKKRLEIHGLVDLKNTYFIV